jgi:hypothetical protein
LSEGGAEPARFFGEELPSELNRTLREQERKVEAERRILEAMRAVDATLCFEVQGEGGGTFFVNLEGGRATSSDRAARPPLLRIVQDRESFDRLVREAGDSPLRLIGGLSGLGEQLRLTRGRVEALAGVAGRVRFEVSGEQGFWLLTCFGGAAAGDAPDATIRVDHAAYEELKAGKLDPPGAFLSGRIEVDGDAQLAMRIALAAMAPE